MMESKQIQKAGNNSSQTVINNYNYGMTEEKALEIYNQQTSLMISTCSEVAKTIASDRVEQFALQLMPRIQQIESDFKSFADPSFQVLLRKAQLTAACTERDDDYKLLTELLAHRINNKHNIKKKASITKAVEIIDQIDDDSLCAMTVFHSMSQFIPISGIISDGLEVLDELYRKLNLADLPNNNLWIDNLSILGAITVVPFSQLEKFEGYLSKQLGGYCCIGIKKDSAEYFDAIENLKKCNMSANILVDNELIDGYVRLAIVEKSRISDLSYTIVNEIGGVLESETIPINEEQEKCLTGIYEQYSSDEEVLRNVKNEFERKIKSYESINKACNWWNTNKQNIILTSVGKAIAHTNAKSIDSELPDLD